MPQAVDVPLQAEPGQGTEMAVRNELVRMLYGTTLIFILTSASLAFLLVVFLSQWDHSAVLLPWLGGLWAALLGLAALAAAYRLRAHSAADLLTWARLHALFSGFAGIAWGMAPVLFLRVDDPVLFVGLNSAIVGGTAGTVSLYASWSPSYFAFSTPVLLLLAFSIALASGPLQPIVLMVFFGIAILGVMNIMAHRQLAGAVRAKFHNRELINAVAEEKEKAERADEAKSQLLAAISHDVRQPLQSMHMYADLLRECDQQDRRPQLQQKMEGSLTTLTNMLDQVLDLSRMDSKLIEVNMQVVDFSDLATRLHEQFARTAAQKGLDWRVQRSSQGLWTDPVLLGRVLDNLVSNALRYTERGRVRIACGQQADMARISVSDTGPGIPEEERERIFTESYQLQNPSRQRSKGLGIGLAIVRRLCDAMGVEIEVTSGDGGGTHMSLYLPAVALEQAGSAGETAGPRP